MKQNSIDIKDFVTGTVTPKKVYQSPRFTKLGTLKDFTQGSVTTLLYSDIDPTYTNSVADGAY